MVSSFNQFSEAGELPAGQWGNGHCNNNNAKSNLNYALKRLGRNNPRHKHKRGGGAHDQMQGCWAGGWASGRDPSPLCGLSSLLVGGIGLPLCWFLGVKMMRVFILGNGCVPGGCAELPLLQWKKTPTPNTSSSTTPSAQTERFPGRDGFPNEAASRAGCLLKHYLRPSPPAELSKLIFEGLFSRSVQFSRRWPTAFRQFWLKRKWRVVWANRISEVSINQWTCSLGWLWHGFTTENR